MWLACQKVFIRGTNEPERRDFHGPCSDGAQKIAPLFGTLSMPNLDLFLGMDS
jgi:hypothetical protein